MEFTKLKNRFIRSKYRILKFINEINNNLSLIIQHINILILSKYIHNYKNIPIIINNFNRFTYLKSLISSLEKRGYRNLYIIDNNSQFEPLIEYYKSSPYKIFKLDKNLGHLSLWKSGVIEYFNTDLFIYTDPDLELIEECPEDFALYLINNLLKNLNAQKIGLSLKIDDIPDKYINRNDVIEWESKFNKEIKGELFIADIDTTFAIYLPKAQGGYQDGILTYRTQYPYQARHLPWYEDSSLITEENAFYIKTKRKDIGHWSSKTEI